MKDLDEIKLKLSKLIAKEESARELGNQAEAEAFASKVQELLLQYELDLGDIRSREAESIVIREERFTVYNKSKTSLYALVDPTIKILDLTVKNESSWVKYLYSTLAETNFCRTLGMRDDPYAVVLIGTDMNREFVHFMVLELVSKIRKLARKSYSEYHGRDKRNTFIRSFYQGCVDGIRRKLQLERVRKDQNSNQIHALVIQKDKMLNDFIEQEYGNSIVNAKAKRRSISQDGYFKGVQAGSTIDHKTELRGNGGTKLLN